MKTGIYELPNNEYRSILEYVSISELNRFGISPLNYKYEFIDGNRQPPSKSQEIGIYIHAYVLEPVSWVTDFQVRRKYDKRTSDGKKMFAEDQQRETETGVKFLDQDTYDQVRFAGDAILNHPFVKDIEPNWKVEQSMFWQDESTGVLCKGRTDASNNAAIFDLKTSLSAASFQGSIVDYGYHRQAAYYLDGLMAASGGESQVTEFYWLVLETKAPYLCKVYKASPSMLERGRHEYKNLLSRFADCKHRNNWPGLSTQVEELELPDWYLRKPIEMFKRGEEF